MSDHDLLINLTGRMLIIENPTDRIQLPPPPPAAVDESAVVWHPTDRGDEMERIPLNSDDDRSAAAFMAVWLGGQALYASLPDPAQEEIDLRPLQKDEDEPDA